MVRNVLGSILALIGAAAAVIAPFRPWYDGREGRDFRIAELFEGLTDRGSGLFDSLLLPFAFAALLTLFALTLRSRALVGLSGLAVLGFTVLWMVRQGQAAGSLALNGDGSGLGIGVAYALGGGIVLLIAALLMSGRSRARQPWPPAPQRQEPQPYQPHPYQPQQSQQPPQDWQYAPQQQSSPYGYDPGPAPQHQPQSPPQRQQPYAPEPYPHPDPYAHPDPHPYPSASARPPDGWSHDGDTQSLPVVDRPSPDRPSNDPRA
ncbi:phage holin family protein [Streptomyces paludis]|uniref:Uncharacterized protein n=1 Tax=Streptomyces paludis TaxID=2282738 RepID=A0A345HS73_9ACTN|nr:hypothetical protein DVK44_19960 [Streptomyces paludis]